MANWSKPTLTSTYTAFVTEVKDRDVEAALWFEGMSPTNLPTNAKRLNTSTGRFEKWNGTAWVDAVATFTFPALTVAGAATFNGNTTIGDAGTDTLTVNAAATFGAGVTFNGAAAFNGSVTLGDAAADAATVNATLTFATAPVLTPGTANGVLFLNGGKVVSSGSSLVFNGSNFGVGVASPASRLDIGSGQALSFGAIEYGLAGVIVYPGIPGGAGNLLYANKNYGAAAVGLGFYNSGAYEAVITARTTGFVGIGTSLPQTKLHVNEGVIRVGDISAGAGLGSYEFSFTGSAALASISAVRVGSNSTSHLIFSTASSGTVAEKVRIDDLGNATAHSSVTGYWQIPRGTTAQRPTGASGMIRFNTSLNRYEGHNGSAWSSIGGGATGGGSDDVFYENGQTVTADYTLTSGKNAMSAGPVTIASGITVTVPSGSTWVVV